MKVYNINGVYLKVCRAIAQLSKKAVQALKTLSKRIRNFCRTDKWVRSTSGMLETGYMGSEPARKRKAVYSLHNSRKGEAHCLVAANILEQNALTEVARPGDIPVFPHSEGGHGIHNGYVRTLQ